MGNLRRASELAAQRKKRHVWRNVVTCIAAFVVFCTTYALILPAITLETQELSCGLPEHTHSAACYQLVCGRQEVYSHTHTRENCYDASGALTCALREQTAHHHTQDCYSVPQPACGQVEHAAHTHGETCYAEGALTCVLAETEGHVHTPECYPADFAAQLICGQQDLPEHIHTDACYIRACGLDEHTHTDACAANHREFVDNLVPTGQTESPATETETTAAATEETDETEATGVTESPAPEATGDASVTEAPATEPSVTEAAATGSPVTEAPTTEAPATEAPAATETTQPEETTLPDTAVATEAPTDPQPTTETPTQDEDIIEDEDTILEPPMLLGAADTAEDGTTKRLVDVATSVTINARYDADGNLIVSYNKDTDRYEASLSLDFHLRTALNPDTNTWYVTTGEGGVDCGREFTLSLGNINVVEGQLGNVKNLLDNGDKAGTYQFVLENGKVVLRVSLLEEYVSKANGITGQIRVNGWMNRTEANEDGNLVYPAEDGEVELVINDRDVKYPDGTSSKGDILVTKSGYYTYSEDGKKLTYTVRVQSTNGTPENVLLEDILTLNGVKISKLASVKVLSGGQTIEDYDKIVSDYKLDSSIDNSVAKISMDLGKFGARQWMEITYEYELEGAPDKETMVDNTAKGSSGADIEYESEWSIKVLPDPEPTKPSETTEPTTPTEPTPEVAKHNGWNNAGETDNQKWNFWRIVINYNGGNIANMVAEDEGFKSATKIWYGIKENGHYRILSEEEYDTHFTRDLENGKITFKPIPADGTTNNNSYEIYYQTERGDLGNWGSHEVINTIKLGERAVTGRITDDRGNVSKKLESLTFSTDKRYHMNWTAAINPGLDGFPLEYKIIDTTLPYGEGGSAKHYYDPSSLRLTYNGTELDSSYYEVTYFDKADGQVTQDDATYMVITLKKDPFKELGTRQHEFENGKHKDDSLVLSYSTCADEAWWGGQWSNKVEYRTKSATDTATFTPSSFEKTDGDGRYWNTTVENLDGKLTWKVRATLSSISNAKELTIVDNLPKHVHVVSLTASSYAGAEAADDATLTIAENGSLSGENAKYTFSGTCQIGDGSDHYTVTLHAASKNGEALGAGTTFVLTLNCQIDQEYLNEKFEGSFTNTAYGSTDEGESLGDDDHTQNWEQYEDDPYENSLVKSGLWNVDNQTLDYRLQINAKAADLQPGSSRLYLTDEFTYDPKVGELDLIYNLVRGSVKLYYVQTTETGEIATDDSGKWLKGGEVTDWRWTADEDIPGSEYGSSKITKIIRLEVPDSTRLILEYSYRLDHFRDGKTDFNLGANNKAYFVAHPDKSSTVTKEWDKWQGDDSQGLVYTSKSLTITKVAENDSSVVIPGVKFVIYQSTEVNDTGLVWTGPITLTNKDGEQISEYTTNSYGKLTVKFDDGYKTNVLYKLEEVETIEGYYLPTENRPSVMFYFKEGDGNGLPAEKYLYADARNLTEQSAFEDIGNIPNVAKFGVEKLWKYANGKDAPAAVNSIDLDLMCVATQVRQATSVSDPLASTARVELYFGNWNTANHKSLTVPKGAVLSITVQNCVENKAKAFTFLPSQLHSENLYLPVFPKQPTNGRTWTYELKITHNVCFMVSTGGEGEPNITHTYTGQPTVDSGDQTNVLGSKQIGTITLNAGNNWSWKSTNLPIRGDFEAENGTVYKDVWFTYYVKESSNDYHTLYTNSEDGFHFVGITSGNITVTNILETPPTYTNVTVNKAWTADNPGEYTSVMFKLIRKEWDHNPSSEELQTHVELAYGEELPAGYTLEGEYTLTKDSNWTWSSGNTLFREYNGKWYTYFIIEQPGDYIVSDSGQVSGGTITVTNTITKKPTTIQVEKQWFDYFGKEANNQQGEVRFELYKVAHVGEKASEPEKVGECYTLSQLGNWKWDSKTAGLYLLAEELKTENGQKVEVTYTYYVVELVDENATEKFTIAYSYDGGKTFVESNTTGIPSGTIIIKNTLPSPEYELPATGGAGTLAYTLAGLTLTLTAALTLTATTRKKRPH